jgi:hypothetical protein
LMSRRQFPENEGTQAPRQASLISDHWQLEKKNAKAGAWETATLGAAALNSRWA